MSVIENGHLDKEDDLVWLGIAVTQDHLGKGIGKKLMNHLIEVAKKLKLNEITLPVDEDNDPAKRLYENYGFKKIRSSENVDFYKMIL